MSTAPARPTLVEEEQRLSALFRGTPVVFTMESSTSLRVDVPRRFCFDAGQAALKPPLVAVLDRLAQSQHDAASRIVVSAPGDAPPKPAAAASAPRRTAKPAPPVLASRRALAVRDRLAAQGIPLERLSLVDADAAGVTVTVRDAPAP